jgi:RNA polymerase sigma-70 factor, ECF subfamily
MAVLTAASAKRSDKELVAALKAGDQAAWREVMQTYGPMLHGYATRMLKDRSAAEEVIQEAIVSVYAGLFRFEGRCSLKSWLFRAVHNKAIDELRRNKRYANAAVTEEGSWESRFDSKGSWNEPPAPWKSTADAQIDAKRVLAAVRDALPSLPHTHRQVLLMKEVQGLSSDEICDVLEISPANLRVSLHRARRALRLAVAPLVEETAQ